jgi:hypothetical protein
MLSWHTTLLLAEGPLKDMQHSPKPRNWVIVGKVQSQHIFPEWLHNVRVKDEKCPTRELQEAVQSRCYIEGQEFES